MVAANINFEHWADFLLQLGAVCEAPEFHGFLVGLKVNAQPLDDAQWHKAVAAFLDIENLPTSAEQLAGLSALNAMVLQALKDGEYRFRLLLPDDLLPINARLDALAQWCQGFLFALGLNGEQCIQHEGLEDLAQIAHLDPGEEDCEENEVYFSELVEYIRVVVLELAAELTAAPSSQADSSLH
jgi:uncharacterized protein